MVRCWLAVATDGAVHHVVKVEHTNGKVIRRIRRPVQQGMVFVEVRGSQADKLATVFRGGLLRFSRTGRDGVVLGRGRVEGL